MGLFFTDDVPIVYFLKKDGKLIAYGKIDQLINHRWPIPALETTFVSLRTSDFWISLGSNNKFFAEPQI